jgi:hypothetical protein
MPLVLFVRVGPVLKIEVEAMLYDDRVNPVKLFRNVEFEPRKRIAYVNDAVWVSTAATYPRKHAHGELEGNQAPEDTYKLS